MEQPTESLTDKASSTKWLLPALFLIVGVFVGYLIGHGDSDAAPSAGERLAAALPQAFKSQPTFLPPQKHFLKVSRSAQGAPETLDVGISVYKPTSGADIEVALVGAIHIADQQYFESLNTELQAYDSVLYELVAPKNMKPDASKPKDKSILSGFQYTLSDLLDVEHQLEAVDYTPANFVHADLSFPELVEEGKRRGETPFTLIAGITLDALRVVQKAEYEAQKQPQQSSGSLPAQQPQSIEEIVALLTDPMSLRSQFAEVLAKSEADENGMAGFTTLTPYLIDARNKAAAAVLRDELAAGKKRIAIFYGAAHLPDFERRLIKEFGMKRVATRWLPAWDLRRQIPKKDPLQLLVQVFRELGQSS